MEITGYLKTEHWCVIEISRNSQTYKYKLNGENITEIRVIYSSICRACLVIVVEIKHEKHDHKSFDYHIVIIKNGSGTPYQNLIDKAYNIEITDASCLDDLIVFITAPRGKTTQQGILNAYSISNKTYLIINSKKKIQVGSLLFYEGNFYCIWQKNEFKPSNLFRSSGNKILDRQYIIVVLIIGDDRKYHLKSLPEDEYSKFEIKKGVRRMALTVKDDSPAFPTAPPSTAPPSTDSPPNYSSLRLLANGSTYGQSPRP